MKKTITTILVFASVYIAVAQVETSTFHQPYRLEADGKILDVHEIGHSGPYLYDYNKDGKLDLLVGYFGKERVEWDQVRSGHHLSKGGCNIYLNNGSNEKPVYTFSGKLMADGVLAYVPTDCCIGFTPCVADLDGDGIDDIISGSYPGQAYFFKGIGEGMFAKHVFLKDKNGKALNPGHTTAITPFDWDEDGDLDLVWGVRFKGVFVAFNESTTAKPTYSEPVQIKTLPYGDKNSAVSSHTVPVDWDNDGLFDLICGTEHGDVILYKNTGKKGSPEFANKPKILIKCNHDHRNAVEGDDKPHGFRSKVFPFDYNNDGKMDLLVGDNHPTRKSIRAELSPEEKVAEQELVNKYRAWTKSKRQILDMCRAFVTKRAEEIVNENPDLTEHEAVGMAWHDLPDAMAKDYKEYEKKWGEYSELITEFRTSKHFGHGFVWVYIQK